MNCVRKGLQWKLCCSSHYKHVSRRTLFAFPKFTLPPRTHRIYDRATHPYGTSAVLAQARSMSLASSQSVRPSEIPKARSTLLRSPTVEDLEEQELDVDIIPKDQINVTLTARAAEVLSFVNAWEQVSD